MTMDEGNLRVCFTGPGRVEVAASRVPSPKPGEALLRTHATLVSPGTERTLLSGEGWSPLGKPGFVLPEVGYSHVGTVVDVGEGVDRAWLGRRVASRSIHARYATCVVAPTPGIWRSGLAIVPDEMSAADATFFALGLTALQALVQGGVGAADRIAILGLGVLGQLVVRAALDLGVRDVTAIGRGAERLAFLPTRPALHARAGGVEQAEERGTFDVVIDVTGAAEAVVAGLGLVKPGGRFVLLGSNRMASTLDLHALCVAPHRTIIGAHIDALPLGAVASGAWGFAEASRRYFALARSEDFPPTLVSHRFAGFEAPRAYAALAEDRSVMGCLLDWESR